MRFRKKQNKIISFLMKNCTVNNFDNNLITRDHFSTCRNHKERTVPLTTATVITANAASVSLICMPPTRDNGTAEPPRFSWLQVAKEKVNCLRHALRCEPDSRSEVSGESLNRCLTVKALEGCGGASVGDLSSAALLRRLYVGQLPTRS